VVFTLVKNSGRGIDSFWDKTTVSVIGQENIVNFNEYTPGKVVTGDFE
jgi:hypothetical protein